jgi:aspartate/methionine/tyrosine aminotransferase
MDEGAGTPWNRALEAVRGHSDFLDLTDSRFHQNGLMPDAALFREEFDRWLSTRAYEPDSRGERKARDAVSAFYQSHACLVNPDDVLLTAGTSEAYQLLFTTLAGPGDVVALPRPGYPLFEHLAQRCGLEVVYYDQPFERLEKAPSRLKLVVVISPNNPSGKVYQANELAHIGAFCDARDAVLVFDEVFDAFVHNRSVLARPGAVVPQTKCATLNGISKRFGSPDLKLAWTALTGPAAWRSETLAKLEFANDLFLSANSYSQALLPRLFRDLGPWQSGVNAVLRTNLIALEGWLDQHPEVVAPRPEGGIHGLLNWPGLPRGWDDERWSLHLLQEFRLAVHPGYFYDVQRVGTLVYSLLKAPAEFATGLNRLSSAWKGLGAFR